MKKLLSIAAAILLAARVTLAGPIPLAAKCQVIDKSGSYIMTGNIVVPPDQKGNPPYCIFVTAPDTTIDMNGFAIIGPGHGTEIGIEGEASTPTLLNGVIAGFPILCAEIGYSRVDGVVMEGCAGGGVSVGPSIVTNSRFLDNGGIGLNIVAGSVTLGNIVSGNGFGMSKAGQAVLFDTVEDNSHFNIVPATPCPSAGIPDQPACVDFGNEAGPNESPQ